MKCKSCGTLCSLTFGDIAMLGSKSKTSGMPWLENISSQLKAIALVSLLVLTGCAVVPPPPPTSSPLGGQGADKSFTFNNVNIAGEKLSTDSIIIALGQSFLKSSKQQAETKIQSQFVAGVSDISGVVVDKIPNALKVSYINGFSSDTSGYRWVTSCSATFSYLIEEGNGTITIKVSPPKEMVTQLQSTGDHFYPQLASDDILKNDISHIYNNLDPVINRVAEKSGEFNSRFNHVSIYNNFNRKLGGFSIIDQKACGLCYKIDGVEVFVKISEYQNGAKVEYTLQLPYSEPHLINGKGNLAYSSVTASAKKVVAIIEKVVND